MTGTQKQPEGWAGSKGAPVPPAAPATLDEFVYVLHAPDSTDERDALSWRKGLLATQPNAAPKLVNEIKLARVSERHSVIVLYRPDGANELKATPQIFAREHWRKEGEDGAVDVRAFVAELAKHCLPAIAKLRRDTEAPEDLGILRVGYA